MKIYAASKRLEAVKAQVSMFDEVLNADTF